MLYDFVTPSHELAGSIQGHGWHDITAETAQDARARFLLFAALAGYGDVCVTGVREYGESDRG